MTKPIDKKKKSSTLRKRPVGRPKGNATQRSIRLIDGAWEALECISAERNEGRDPLDSQLDVTKLINMAIRDFLEKNGYAGVYERPPVQKAS